MFDHTRRNLLRTALGAGALAPALPLTGCADLIDAVAKSCPDDPAESAGVDWIPDALHPMFYGFKDYDVAQGAPGPVRVFYPTYEGSPQDAPILKLCVIRYPVVLFLHGMPPCPVAEYNKQWFMGPAVLARCGYVVAVPNYSPQLPEADSPNIALANSYIDWMRHGWEHSKWADARESSTAVVGHSYGALLAGRVAAARPDVAAYVGLSGPWAEFSRPLPVLQAIPCPSFYMWGTADPIGGAFENLDGGGGLWSKLTTPRYAAVFPGEHFDYIRPIAACGGTPRGDCLLIESVAAELSALFIARKMPVATSHTPTLIPVNLDPPTVTLTTQQAFFAGAHLNGIQLIRTREGCRVDLRWDDGGTGSRRLGP